ncbi:MAG TPA: RHS repeat-associated core domain-containing protein [Terriglobia bacterium]|nr:RHS repeat-associated core domain-containing protein [Terriglobia bacterium]
MGSASPPCSASQGAGDNGKVTGYTCTDNTNSVLLQTATYGSDGVNRLTRATATGNAAYNLTFSYDSHRNMICNPADNPNGPCPGVTFDASTNHINQIGSAYASYDAAGDLTGDGVDTYQYDAEGRLLSENSGSPAVYNALGEQAAAYASGTLYSNFYDPNGLWLGNTFGSSVLHFGQRLFALSTPGSTQFIHENLLGSTAINSDPGGNPMGDMLFYPWGQVWPVGITNGLETHRAAFPARGGDLNGAPFRVYDDGYGRWLTPDPLGGDITNPQSLNRYAYVLNNPATLADPLGLNQDCSYDVTGDSSGAVANVNCPPDRDTVGYSPGGCAGIYVNGGYVGSTCGGGTGSLYGGHNSGGGAGGGTLVAQSPLSLRQKGQTFTQCMQQNSNKFSIGGAGQSLFNKLTGANSSLASNPIVSTFTGNGVAGLLFGAPDDQAASAAALTPRAVDTAMGSVTTWGRRTTDIFDLNLLGKGGVPQALSSGTSGIKSFLGELDNALSLGMEFTTRLAVDSLFTLNEAYGCTEHSTSSTLVF